jgi:hypothetical protein
MRSRMLLSLLILLTSSGVAAADPYNDLEKKVAKQLSQFGTIEWIMYTPSVSVSAPATYYLQMAKLTFPGGSYPVIFPITCTPIGGKPGDGPPPSPTNFFCTAAVPSSVGIPSAFPASFVMTLP